MALVRTGPLRAELERCLPQRPFEVEFWDESRLPSTTGNGGPRFRVRSPQAVAHVLRAPGQLGIGRAYVSGELEVDDIDAALGLLDTWRSCCSSGPIFSTSSSLTTACDPFELTTYSRRLIDRGSTCGRSRAVPVAGSKTGVKFPVATAVLSRSLGYLTS
jgi:hypothetical protein